jgi:D-alanyl-D-alanine carboxypeptidase
MIRPGAAVALMLASVATSASAVEIVPCPPDTGVPASVAEQLDGVLSAAADTEGPLSAAFGAAPGAVLTLVAPDWHYARAAGVADPDTGTAVTCDMPFQVGSNTKMMTATVVLQLQEEGALSLNDPLSAHLPEIAAALPNGADISLRQLANHTAGVFSYTDNAPDGAPGIMEGDLTDPEALRRGYAMSELVDFAIEHGEPSFAPGAEGQWSYSNTGYILLGLIIEAIEGQPIAETFEARIFGPLGMEETFYATGVPTPEMGLPRAFVALPFGVETTDWNLSQGAAAGAVISTAEDMHVFIRALLNGDLFTSADTLAAMMDVVETGTAGIPAYGIGLAEKLPGVWGHGGQTLGFESEVALFAESGISAVGWGTSSQNIMGVAVNAISTALMSSGAIPDPAAISPDALRAAMVGADWRLTMVLEIATQTQSDMDPERYGITFEDNGDFNAQADCNRLLGSWSIEDTSVSLTPGPTTRAACPPDSRSDDFITWLAQVTSAQLDNDGGLMLTSGDGDDLTLLQFEPAE